MAAGYVARVLAMGLGFREVPHGEYALRDLAEPRLDAEFPNCRAAAKDVGNRPKPADWEALFYPGLLRTIDPAAVDYVLP
jgi:hypothetical protein